MTNKQKLILPIEAINEMIIKLYDEEIGVNLRVQNFLHSIRDKIYFDKALIFFYKKVDATYEVQDCIPIDWQEMELRDYIEHYCKMDDTLAPMNIKTPIIFRCSELFDAIERKKTLYYKEFIAPANLEYSIEGNLNLLPTNQLSGGIGLYRAIGKKDFSEAELALIKLFQPHLSNVLKDYRTEGKNIALSSIFGLLEGHNAVGICMLDENYSFINCNETYQRIINEQKEVKDNIEAKIRELCKMISDNKIADTKNCYEYKFEDCAIFLDVNKKENNYICFVYDLSYVFLKSLRQLQKKYALTSKEFEIVNRVLQGQKYEDIAKQLFISLHTVKKHLSTIYEKMGLESQREIIRKLEVF